MSQAELTIESLRGENVRLSERVQDHETRFARELAAVQSSYQTDVARMQELLTAKDATIASLTQVWLAPVRNAVIRTRRATRQCGSSSNRKCNPW